MGVVEYLIIAVVAILIQYLIIRAAVSDGTSANYKNQQMRIQTNLLTDIARKLGVEEEDIDKSFKN